MILNTPPKRSSFPPRLQCRELANSIQASPIEVIKNLMANGVMANINQQIDFDTAAIVAAEMGYEATLENQESQERGTWGNPTLAADDRRRRPERLNPHAPLSSPF